MRHLITSITETIKTAVDVRRNGIVVADLVTRVMRAGTVVRSLLLRLTGQMPARMQVVQMGHRLPADVGGPHALRHYCLSTLRLRPSWRGVKPGSGALTRKF